jgi:hypothetical protein
MKNQGRIALHWTHPSFLGCKGVKKRVLGRIKGSYGFDRYLGITITASLRLSYHYSVTAIANVTSFYTGLKVSIALFIADLFPVSISISRSKNADANVKSKGIKKTPEVL